MQKTLSIKVNKKTIVSKPWDFRALCLVQDIHTAGKTNSVGMMCGDAVDYLFEGTEATQEILDANIVEKMVMCRKVWNWYLETMTALKNVDTPQEGTTAEEKTEA